jgi:hypothetical protein
LVVPSRWTCAAETMVRLVATIGTASDTSKRSVTPMVTKKVDWLTSAPIALAVVTTSSRPPRSSALSWVKTAGTCPIGMPSTESNVNRWKAKPVDTRLAPIVSARSARMGPKLCRALKHAERGIELEGEAAAGRRQRNAHELTDEGEAELPEVELEVADEMGGVWLLAGQGRQAVHHKAPRPEQVLEDRGEVRHRRRQVVGILSFGGPPSDEQACDDEPHTSGHTFLLPGCAPIPNLDDHPPAPGAAQRELLPGIDCLASAAEIEHVPSLDHHRRGIPAEVDRGDGE